MFGIRLAGFAMRGSSLLLLLLHLFLHAALHFAESFFNFPAGDIDRYHQFKDELVKDINSDRP